MQNRHKNPTRKNAIIAILSLSGFLLLSTALVGYAQNHEPQEHLPMSDINSK